MTHCGEGFEQKRIVVNLSELPAEARHIFFCASVFTLSKSFQNAAGAVAVIQSKDGAQLLSHEFEGGAGQNGFVFARLSKEAEGWCLQPIQRHMEGRTVRHMIPCLLEMCTASRARPPQSPSNEHWIQHRQNARRVVDSPAERALRPIDSTSNVTGHG